MSRWAIRPATMRPPRCSRATRLTFAGHTQNRRLLARAHVWQGITYAAAPSRDLDRARQSCEAAMALLQPEMSGRQYVWDDLEILKARVLETRPVDPLLRAWSAGRGGQPDLSAVD